MFKHVLGIIDLKKTKEWQKIYPQYNFISFSFILMKNWRFNDCNDWFKLQKLLRTGTDLLYFDQIFLNSSTKGTQAAIWCSGFPIFLYFYGPLKMVWKRCDWFCNHVTYWIHWTKRQVWTHWRRYWYYNDLKKKKIIINNIILKFKREGFLWTESELVTSNCSV